MNFKIAQKLYFPDFTSPTGGVLTTFGTPSKTVVLASEEEKIAIEFTTAAAVKEGQFIKIDATGKAAIWLKADGRSSCIGYALFDAPSGGLVTVQTRGYAILYGIAAAIQAAGLATTTGYDTTNSTNGTQGYNLIAISATDSELIGWALDASVAQYDLIRFLLRD